jgi:hypothetical protein
LPSVTSEGHVRGDAGDIPKGFAFLAIAHRRLGHRDEAKRWLDKLLAYRPEQGYDSSWDDVDIRNLCREALALISGSSAATMPASPSR